MRMKNACKEVAIDMLIIALVVLGALAWKEGTEPEVTLMCFMSGVLGLIGLIKEGDD